MKIRKTALARSDSGQSMVEIILMIPLLLAVVLNAVNFGYLFFVVLNLSAATRSGVEYSMLGAATPSAIALPLAGPPTPCCSSITYLTYQDMTGAVSDPTGTGTIGATIQVCTQTNTKGTPPSGLNGTGVNQRANCVTCTGTSCGSVNNGATGLVPDADPEAPSFVLNRVDVTYTFPPLLDVPPFTVPVRFLPGYDSTSGTCCTFSRHVEMRAMN
jgi:Flp pilus assembly protein TadG